MKARVLIELKYIGPTKVTINLAVFVIRRGVSEIISSLVIFHNPWILTATFPSHLFKESLSGYKTGEERR